MQQVKALFKPGQVIELRILDTGTTGTISGYFDDIEKLTKTANRYSGNVPGVYITLNPINPALIARANNKIITRAKHTTSDADIIARRWLPIDIDCGCPAGISSTNEEKEKAKKVAQAIRDFLGSKGWTDPVVADSGNGWHLLYRIDLPNDNESRELVKNCLEVLDLFHSEPPVKVDTATFNAARIWKLYGTMACKGENLPERPHRLAKITSLPENIQTVPVGKLRELAGLLPKPGPTNHKANYQTEFNLAEWIRSHNLPVVQEKDTSQGHVWVLNPCPGDPNHQNRSAFIIQLRNGAIGAKCHHNNCRVKSWHDIRDIYEPGWRDNRKKTHKKQKIAGVVEFGNGNIPSDTSTDFHNAQRLVTKHGQDLRYCYPWRKWLVWDGSRWEIDNTQAVMRAAKDTVKLMVSEAAEILSLAVTNEERERANEKLQAAIKCFSRQKLEAMIILAQSEPGIPVVPEELDKDPWLFNVKNGTLSLQTGQLQPARREDLLTKISPVEYDANAACPLWLNFLERIFAGNRGLISYIQKATGYSLTGDVSEQVLFIPYGKGANGKSVFLNTLLYASGNYGKPAALDLLMAKKNEQHPTELADLKGARLVTVIESGEGKRLAENLIKQLTGGDRLKARRMREDFWDFEPTHKIWLATNHKPVIRGSDHAIWRRIRLIPFQVTIPENEQDKHLLEKLKKELPGILRWMVEGCLLWQREGLETPEEVKNATQKYKTEMDVITNFLNDTCIINSLAKVAVTELYAVYVSWCEENGEHQVSRQNLVSKLEEQGFEKRRGTENKLFLHGIGLLENGKKLPKLSKLRNFRMNARELVRVEVNRKKVNFSNFDNFLGKEGSDEREEPNTSKTKQEAGEYNLDNLPFD